MLCGDVPKHARRKCRSLSVRDIARKVVSIKTTNPTLQPNIGITQRFKIEFLPPCASKQGIIYRRANIKLLSSSQKQNV